MTKNNPVVKTGSTKKPRVKKEKLPSRLKDFTPLQKTVNGVVSEVEGTTEIEKSFGVTQFSDDDKDLNIASIEKIINSQVKEEKESKEIFITKNIKARTDINDNEVSVISRLLFLCEDLELRNLEMTINNFMELRLSKGRKSRKEFIESIKSLNQNTNMFPMNNLQGGNSGHFR